MRKRQYTGDERGYMDFIRGKPCVVAESRHWSPIDERRCGGKMEFAHLKHDGMGGSLTNPIIGNGVPACTAHHTGSQGMDTIGQRTFAARHGLDLDALAAKYQAEWKDGFL